MTTFKNDTRGVQWTLEAFLAVLFLLSAVVVVAAVVPTGTGQAEAELSQAQLQQAGDDVLTLAEQENLLHETLLYWDSTDGAFIGTETDLGGAPHYVTFTDAPDHPLAELLSGTLGERHIAYTLHIEYQGETGSERRPIVYQGPAGGDSVTASKTVILTNSDEPTVTSGDDCETLGNLSECGGDSFYAVDTSPSSERYTVVQVELELWRV